MLKVYASSLQLPITKITLLRKGIKVCVAFTLLVLYGLHIILSITILTNINFFFLRNSSFLSHFDISVKEDESNSVLFAH